MLNINWQCTHLPQTAQDASNIRYMAHAERAELARCPTGAWYGLPSDPLHEQAAWHGTIDFFGARVLSKNKTMHETTANKERQEGKCERLGCCGMENSSWEGREGRGPGGKEGDASADTNIDEGEEEENDGEREKNRRAEERTREEGGKEEGRGNASGGGEKVSRKGERRRRRWRRSQQQYTKTRKRGGGTGEEGPGSVQHAKIGRGGHINRYWHGRSARE